MRKQLELQEEIIAKTGLNLVTCGNCGSTIIHEKNQTVILCNDCGFISEPCDFPDLNVSGTTREMEHPLTKYVIKQELILEDIFLFGDDEEKDPQTVLCNSDVSDFPIIFAISKNNDRVRIWELTEPQSIIEVKYKDEILKYRLSKVTKDDEVSLGDIFMHQEHIKELTISEWEKKLTKSWGSID